MLNEIALRQPQAGTWEAACDCAVLISSPWAVLLPTLGTLVPGSPPPSLYSLVSFFLCVLVSVLGSAPSTVAPEVFYALSPSLPVY